MGEQTKPTNSAFIEWFNAGLKCLNEHWFVTMADALAFVLDPDLDPASTVPGKRLMAVRGFTRYLSAIDPRTEVPPAGLVSYRPSGRVPYLFSDQDVAAVVRAARASTPFPFSFPGSPAVGLAPLLCVCLSGFLPSVSSMEAV